MISATIAELYEVPARHFAGGSYYNLIALAGGAFSAPRLLVAETSLQRHVRASASMPEAADGLGGKRARCPA